MKRLRWLLWPVALLVAGVAAGAGAEVAAARFENYPLYGLVRPVADLLLVIGALWLVVALARAILGRRGGR